MSGHQKISSGIALGETSKCAAACRCQLLPIVSDAAAFSKNVK